MSQKLLVDQHVARLETIYLYVCVWLAQAQSGTTKPILSECIGFLFLYGILSTCTSYMNNLRWCNLSPGQQYRLVIARTSFLKSTRVVLHLE